MEVTLNINIYKVIFAVIVAIVVSIVIILVYINKNSKKLICTGENNESNEHRKNIITKKDMAYWIIFLIIISIMWGSSHIYEKEDFTQYVSFSGTVTSIVLGVVAIIYSFFQSFDNASSKESLQSVSNNLKKSSEEIKDHTEKVSGFNDKLIELSTALEKTVNDIGAISDNVDKAMISLENRLKNVESKVDEANSTIKRIEHKKFEDDDWQEVGSK